MTVYLVQNLIGNHNHDSEVVAVCLDFDAAYKDLYRLLDGNDHYLFCLWIAKWDTETQEYTVVFDGEEKWKEKNKSNEEME